MNEWSTLLTAIGDLIGTVVWPAVVVAVAFIFRRPISGLLQSDDLTLTGPGGLGLTTQRRAEAADALVGASASKGGEKLSRQDAVAEVDDSQRQLRRVQDPVVLWVDDKPSNNRYERDAMEALGMTFVLSTSTDDALQKVSAKRYDVIISDMGRPDDPAAGYTLLGKLRATGNVTPYVLYTAGKNPDQFDEAVRRGAVGSTSTARELIRMVVGALKVGPVADAT